MINFEFTDEQRMIRDTIREFGKKELTPRLRQMDEEKKIPDEIIRKLAELGLLGMSVSHKFGGAEADPVTVGLVAEELAWADISCAVPTFFLVQAAWGYILDRYGREEVKGEVLPRITAGKAFLGIAATEPDAGSDLASIRTAAGRDGPTFVLNGEKMFISGLHEILDQLPEGGGYVTVAKTDASLGARGISLFYVPVKKGKNLSFTSIDDWGRRAISTGGFKLENYPIPEENLIGQENKGFKIAMEGFNYARAIISVVCCGVAMRALEQAMDYIKIRKAFGQAIGKYEGIQFKLAEHWARLEAVRLLGYKALWTLNQEQKVNGPGSRQSPRLCAQAKLMAPPFAFEAINEAIQWFGAFGYTEECPLHLALRGVRSYFWAEGSLEIMKIIVARELLGKEYIAYR